jgi:hypothetical protein
MFGYLNLNDPTKIQNNEAQEAKNCRVDRGYLEYQAWSIDEKINREIKDFEGRRIYIDPSLHPSSSGAYPDFGWLVRVLSGGAQDIVGVPAAQFIPGWAIGTTPSATAVAYGSQPYPVGTYEYAITLYDPTTFEESVASILTRAVGVNEVIEFAGFPAASGLSVMAAKTGVQWRIYRRPIGGSEFLLTLSGATLQAYAANAGPHQDITADADLGVACDSFENNTPEILAANRRFRIIAEHNSKLWFTRMVTPTFEPGSLILAGQDQVIYYSRTNKLGAIPEDNYFLFQDEIVNALTLSEAMVIITAGGVYVVYGQDENDFLGKRINDSGVGGVRFGAAVVGNNLYFLGSSAKAPTIGAGIYALAGNELRKMSGPIEPRFPVTHYDLGAGKPSAFGAGAIEDRFFVVRHGSTSGNGFIVFDTQAPGFLEGNSSGVFSWRSKEFGRPGPWDDMRRAFVRGIGQYRVELYGDGEKIDEIDFSHGAITTEDFTVPGTRHNYFSFRIIGQPGAKVYEFGRFE